MGALSGKVAIVTGGAASIGAAITRRLHADGARVVIADRAGEKADALAAALGEAALSIVTDLRDDDALQRLVADTIARFGRLDSVVNNACSYGDDGPATTRATWLDTLNVSAVSAALLGELARPHLAAARGCIVNIGSISGQFPHVGRWAYPVAKAALRHLSRAQALDYATDGIRVNMVTLGHTWSDPFDGLTGGDRAHADAVTRGFNLMGRVGDAAEVAAVVAFVASDAFDASQRRRPTVEGGSTEGAVVESACRIHRRDALYGPAARPAFLLRPSFDVLDPYSDLGRDRAGLICHTARSSALPSTLVALDKSWLLSDPKERLCAVPADRLVTPWTTPSRGKAGVRRSGLAQ